MSKPNKRQRGRPDTDSREPRKPTSSASNDLEPTAPPEGLRMRLSLRKRLAFASVLIGGLLLLSELVLALFGVRPRTWSEDPFVGFASYVPLFVADEDAGGDGRMVTAENKRSYFNRQSFAAVKPPNTVRVFCMGGSTTFGRPYADATSFCGWLREMLPVVDPTQDWELVNAGGISYASYRVARVMEELADYDPDLFIVYTGQNEFLEKRTYADIIETPGALLATDALLSRTRTYTALRGALASLKGGANGRSAGRATLAEEVDTVLDRSVGPEVYQRDDALRRNVLEHLRSNLHRMVDIAESAAAEIVLVTPASNLRDCTPFKSQHRSGLTAAERKQWQAEFTAARDAHDAGQYDQALAATDRALTIDDRRADLHFLRGRILWSLGRFEEARAAYVRARDEDVCPLRALTEMGEIVREVGAARGVAVVDYERLIAEQSAHGTPGADLFLDHVHPTIEGHRWLAERIVVALADLKFVTPSPGWNDAAMERVSERVLAGVDDTARKTALLNLGKVLAWAGKDEEAKALAERAAEINPDDAQARMQIAAGALSAGNFDEAIEELRRALALEPDRADAHFMLGTALARAGRGEEAIEHYKQAVRLQPDDAEAQEALGTALAIRGQTDEAIRHLREAVRLDGDDVSAQYNLARALQARGDREAAVLHFTQVIGLDPRHFGARYNLAMVTRSMGRLEEAIGQFRAAVNIQPENAPAQYQLGVTLEALGRSREALEHLRAALAVEPDDALTLRATAWILAGSGDVSIRDLPEAVRLAERAVDTTQRRDLGALDTLSMVYAAAGRYEDAIAAAESAKTLAEESPNAAQIIATLDARISEYSSRGAASGGRPSPP